MNIFLVGIKGSGMSALALYLKGLGHNVSGSDVVDYIFTEDKLKASQIALYDFKYTKYDEYDLIIRGNSIEKIEGSINYTEAINMFKKGKLISIAGTHGKTTTSTILSQILEASYIIGDGSGAYIDSNYIILESCEYKDTFLNYKPEYSIITCIDYDHVDFFKTKEDIIKSYKKFINLSKVSIVCQDLISVTNDINIEYGFTRNLEIIEKTEKFTTFKLKNQIFKTNLLGEHNISNLAGCILLLNELGETINKKKLLKLKMPKSRFEIIENKYTDIVLDYAHHPVEIEATLKTVKQKYPNRKIVIVFQAHTHSRTKQFYKEFNNIFRNYTTYICPVFGSNREKQEKQCNLLDGLDYFKKFNITNHLDSVIIYMGAGDIYKLLNNL